jgi:hypothetical protein
LSTCGSCLLVDACQLADKRKSPDKYDKSDK